MREFLSLHSGCHWQFGFQSKNPKDASIVSQKNLLHSRNYHNWNGDYYFVAVFLVMRFKILIFTSKLLETVLWFNSTFLKKALSPQWHLNASSSFFFFNVCLLCTKVPLGVGGVGNNSKMRPYILFHLIFLLYKSICLVWISNVSCCEAFQIKTVLLLLKPRIQVLLSSFPKWSL